MDVSSESSSYCSMAPYCEWGSDCRGVHSFSSQASEETIDHPVREVPDLEDDGNSARSIEAPSSDVDGEVDPLDVPVAPDSDDDIELVVPDSEDD